MIIGRFAPSPTGPLHEGSLVAALASWLDARAQGGRWLVRIEDLDPPREVPGATETILWQLDRCGLQADERPMKQSMRGSVYQAALDQLTLEGWAYPCACSRKEIADSTPWLGGTSFEGSTPATRDAALLSTDLSAEGTRERVYRNTCRLGLHGRAGRAMRLRVSHAPGVAGLAAARDERPVLLRWHDRRLGDRTENLSANVGDFVLKRADGFVAYQLAVVVDDAAQGVTDVVRGADLAGSTARQIYLQQRLGLPTPRYLHTPLVMGADGHKLSKQNGALPLALAGSSDAPLIALRRAASVLGIAADGTSLADWLAAAVVAWRALRF